MKSIALVNSDKYFDNDFIFQKVDENNLLFPFYMLKTALLDANVSIHTSDLLPIKDAHLVIYNEVPKKLFLKKRDLPLDKDINKSILMLLECQVIRPDNYDLKLHKFFNKILTWDDSLVASDSSKYIKSNFVQSLYSADIKSFDERTNFCVCISGNKKVSDPNELYSERKKVIKWFEKYEIQSFGLYGRGWGHFKVSSSSSYSFLNRIFSYFPPVKNLRKSWRGGVENKQEVLSIAKFNLCFENAYGYEGYITEKIFDTFKAGAVPIYWGASNISHHIPSNCYIDFRDFKNIDECFQYMKSISSDEFANYQRSIKEFMSSDLSKPFAIDAFINNIKRLLRDQK